MMTYIFSIFLALAFHVGVIGLLFLNWEEATETEITPIEPYYIEASVVSGNPYKEREKKAAAAKEQSRVKAIRERDARLKAQADRQARLQEDALQEALKKAEEDTPVPQVEQDSTVESEAAEGGTSEAERLRMEQSLALAILDEQEYRRAVTDDEKAMAFVAQIQREIVQNWSRPPSARNGMKAVLRVFLVPTGEVVNVVVEESSGNDAFDRSALLAVQKAERFQVPGDSRQFERNFREFTVLFRPEDLRL